MGRKPCCCKVGLKRGAWSSNEDKLLIDHIRTHGEGHWRSLPSKAGLLRCGKSCRLRWVNYLRPGIKRGNFTTEEDDIIIRLHSLHGNRWSLIATELSGRTDNEIKNYWNAHLRKPLNNRKTKTMSRKKPKQVKLLASASCSSLSLISTSKNKSIENEKVIGESSTYTFDLEDVDYDFDFTWLNLEPFLEVEDKSRSDDQQDEGLLMDGWKSFMSKDDESLMLEKVYQEHVNLLNHQDVNENTNEIKKIL